MTIAKLSQMHTTYNDDETGLENDVLRDYTIDCENDISAHNVSRPKNYVTQFGKIFHTFYARCPCYRNLAEIGAEHRSPET